MFRDMLRQWQLDQYAVNVGVFVELGNVFEQLCFGNVLRVVLEFADDIGLGG